MRQRGQNIHCQSAGGLQKPEVSNQWKYPTLQIHVSQFQIGFTHIEMTLYRPSSCVCLKRNKQEVPLMAMKNIRSRLRSFS